MHCISVLTGSLLFLAASAIAQPASDGQHDFEFGAWDAHIARLQNPLSDDTTWVEYEGTSIVRPVWGRHANLGELDVEGPAGRIEGLSLRTYNPETGEWYIHWASSRDGVLGPAMVGRFEGNRCEFYK